MSGIPTINVVDDEEMSSQGSVNAPVAPLQPVGRQSPIPPVPQSPVTMSSIPTQQSGVSGPSGTVPVESTEVVAAPTIVVDAPSREETKKAFEEVSSVLQQASSAHEEVRTGMQSLASDIESLRRKQAGDVETTAQLQQTLQRTLSASSSLEMRVGQTEQQQSQTVTTAVEAKRASEEALSQTSRLQEEQKKVTQQMSQALSAQAEEAQKKIEDATQVALQTQQDVRGISTIARQADFTAKRTAAELEVQIKQMAQRLAEQGLQAERRSQAAKIEQAKLVQQLAEAQRQIQMTASTSQPYAAQMSDLTQKMSAMEKLLVEQRQKGMRLESELSAAQDRIGGAERRAQQLTDENVKIQSELQSWQEWYQEDTGTRPSASEELTSPVSQPSVPTSVPVFIAQPEPYFGETVSATTTMSTPMSTPLLSSPILGMGNVGRFDSAGNFTWANPGNPNENMGSGNVPVFPPQQNRRESFGSVFPGSSGTAGNGNGGSVITSQRHMPMQTATFNIGIKPKEPPVFNGRANEDVDTWLAKVGDFIYLTEANDRQQVAYMATLLQEAAADWWTSLLKERHGARPADFVEMSVLLQKRFGSTTRVDRARAALRNIKQGQSESVRSFSTRFEALLAKLPTFDSEWAKTQYIWGLHQRVAELVVIAEPGDLRAAIHQAEKIEMARGSVSGNTQGQKSSSWNRGRGGMTRGRGRFHAIQQSPGQSSQYAGNESHQFAVAQAQNQKQYPPVGYNQCSRCKGWGHWSYDCPTPPQQGQYRGRGGGRMMRGRTTRGRRGGRNGQRGRGRQTPVNASLTASGSGAPVPQPQVQDAAPVPVPPRPGN